MLGEACVDMEREMRGNERKGGCVVRNIQGFGGYMGKSAEGGEELEGEQ